MLIQINTDDNVSHSNTLMEWIETTLTEVLERFADQVTRLEVHLSDENSDKKSGGSDMRCLLEARLKGRQPVAVTDAAPTVEQAVDGAVHKMRRSLDSTFGRLNKR
ncbi:HPF/RaiA family ribosome-associated protein [Ectothiorhodospira lacustris]|uniref:HPF/RaiA family ribosome-associated protein n=1 Tax=Ectothiorhodospira lacustris TaxID=2899127 RepID=UPI001EE8AC47|nr:HPF/RaiA family ribosome-associated protein [Ectothiorhodospira lacustris]MCG5500283.1 HPF/RaiA family ribosome-associated protein [Ectothiorhodospira lacustris]MCG5511140.1 HPF/RaiA family ribosome-associated protein [Ectothiorhodospira lacustris]MCG5522804.1 HPF/RaiA family ribosome-associated protein [Ectothiorhodospira lacustris]